MLKCIMNLPLREALVSVQQSKQKELLCPAGDYQSFLAAIQHGADAIYLSGTSFGARAYAKNFTQEELKQAITLGHLYGVKVYVTMNTMIKEKEVSAFLKQVDDLYQLGVDAILMQDIGMICLCRKQYPDLEIHASTQLNCSTEETLRLLEEIGVKRVVFPREMSIDTINKIKTSLEKEVFIHGALCVSYSGNCLFSFLNGGRSANRGECAGACRMPYRLLKNGQELKEGYLLSMKELHTAPLFSSLLESDIQSFKIEGRMKSPSYVACVTKYYRQLMDGLLPSHQDLDELKILFFREFTKGHLFEEQDFINPISPNHKGLAIGKVEKVTPQKIWIRLEEPLYQEDGIRFQKSQKGMMVNYLYNEKGQLTSQVPKGALAIVDNKVALQEKEEVYKTSSQFLQKQLQNVPKRKVPITMQLKASIGKPLKLTFKTDAQQVCVEGSIVEAAKTAQMTQEELLKLLSRLKDTPFEATQIDLEMDAQIFIRVGEINALRRTAVEKLIAERTKVVRRKKIEKLSFPKMELQQKTPLQTAFVKKEATLKEALQQNYARIYVENEALFRKYQQFENVYFVLPRNQWKRTESFTRIFTQELRKAKGNCIGGYSLNVANSYSAYFLSQFGYQSIMLSVELSKDEIDDLLRGMHEKFGTLPLEMLVKGPIESMIILGNPLKIKANEKYQLQDIKKNLYPVCYNEKLTIVYGKEPVLRLNEIKDWYQKGVSSFCQILDE